MTNPFTVLGLPTRPDLTDEQVRAAWRAIAAASHPDRPGGGNPALYAAASAAYAALRTPGRGRRRTPTSSARPHELPRLRPAQARAPQEPSWPGRCGCCPPASATAGHCACSPASWLLFCWPWWWPGRVQAARPSRESWPSWSCGWASRSAPTWHHPRGGDGDPGQGGHGRDAAGGSLRTCPGPGP